MDQVIASYENDKDISIGIISEAIGDIFGGFSAISPEFQEVLQTKPQ